MMHSRYALDKSNAKLMVCAGFARWADVDPLLVRVTLGLLAVFIGPVVLPAYLLTALIAEQG